jgi:hypothetical protein
MAKIYELSEGTLDIFETIIGETGLERYLKVAVLGKKMKKDLYKVAKSNDIAQFKLGIDAVIIVDEDIFIQLDVEQQKLIAEEAVCGIGWNSEKDIMVMSKPDIQTFTGILSKFTNEKVLQTKEAIKLALESRNQTEKEEKIVE